MQSVGPAQLLDHRAAERLNLAVLKRIDPATEEVLASANHVALYDFHQGQNHWVRKDVEGSLFLIRRNMKPFIRMVVLNKKSNQNYVEDIVPGFQCEKSRPYLLYRSKDDQVVGIWFYEAEEADKVEALLNHVTAAHAAARAQWQVDMQPMAEAAGSNEDGFWDQRAATSPHNSDLSARQQQLVLPGEGPDQLQSGSSRQDPMINNHSEYLGGMLLGDNALQLPQREQPSHSNISVRSPAAAQALPQPDTEQKLPMCTAPSHSPPTLLKGINGLQQGAAMTPEQSNLAKLLSNMHMPSSGAATRTQPIPLLQQQNAPAAFLPVTSAAHPRMPTMHLQPPCFHQPTAMGTMPGLSEAEEGMDSQTGQPTSQPALLTPKFLAAGQQGEASVAGVATTEPQIFQGIDDLPSALLLPLSSTTEDTSLHRFFPKAAADASALSAGVAPAAVSAVDTIELRRKLREVILALSNSDTFIDILGKELLAVGLMPL